MVTRAFRSLNSRPRSLLAFTTIILGYALLTELPLPSRVVASCDMGCVVFLVLTWSMMVRSTPSQMRLRSRQMDHGKWAFLVLTVGVAFFALIATVIEMNDAKSLSHLGLAAHLTLAIGAILSGWLVMHTTFAIHYAHAYYGAAKGGNDKGGLDFLGDEPPDYWDFLYFSLVLGMTSQVSDVTISRRSLRRLALAHSVLSFFFNAVILAMTINLIAGLES